MNAEEKIAHMSKRLVELGLAELTLSSKIETVQAACCAVFGIPFLEFIGNRRHEAITVARFASMQICRDRLHMTLAEIGEHHGGRDHGTVIHGKQRALDLLETDLDFKRRYEIAIKLIEELA